MVRPLPTCYDQNFSSCSWDRDSATYDTGYSTTFCSQVCAHGGGRVGTLSMWVCHKLIKKILLLVRSREIVVEEVKRTTANINYILHYPKREICIIPTHVLRYTALFIKPSSVPFPILVHLRPDFSFQLIAVSTALRSESQNISPQ